MKKVYYILLLAICWNLIVIIGAAADTEVKEIPNKSLDPKGTSTLKNKGDTNAKTDGFGSTVDPNKADRIKDGKDQINGSKKGVKNNKPKEGLEKDKVDADKKKKLDKGSEPKETTKEVDVSSPPVRKEGYRVEVKTHREGCSFTSSAVVVGRKSLV